MAAKTKKKPAAAKPTAALTPEQQVKTKYKSAKSVNVGDKCMIISKDAKMIDYSKLSLSGLCENSAGAWKQALHRML